MSAPYLRLPDASGSGGGGAGYPRWSRRRVDDLLLLGLAGLVPVVAALAIALHTPNPNLALFFALLVGVAVVVALLVYPRLEVTVTILALYLGLLDGPVRLIIDTKAVSSVRDVLIFAVALGALGRMIARGERIRLPPLTGWVAAFVGLVLIEAFNPNTHGILKVLGGFRQQLEWVPFFFFGYVLIRSKERFRKLFIVLGVIALANAAVATYQTHLTPTQLASWGPGYAERVNGNVNPEEKGVGTTARRYRSEGVLRVRPMALGTDSGFGGSVGVIALPGALALLAVGGRRRRWLAILLCLGSLVAVATGLGRLQVVGAVIAVACFALLSLSAGRRVTRPLSALLAVAVLALPLGALFVASEGAGVFSRYESIEPNNVVTTSTTYKERSLALIPHYISSDAFGFGLATAGPASGFGGGSAEVLEGHGVTAETQYNYVVDELGLPGLILWVGLTLMLAALVVGRLPRIRDIDVRIALAAVFAVVFAYTLMGLRGAFMDSSAGGPYFWFAVGIAAYWLVGTGWRAQSRRVPGAGASEPAGMEASAA
jgi:hypothetical protein